MNTSNAPPHGYPAIEGDGQEMALTLAAFQKRLRFGGKESVSVGVVASTQTVGMTAARPRSTMRLSSPEAANDLKVSQAPVVGSAPSDSNRCGA